MADLQEPISKKQALIAGLFILLTGIGTTYFVTQDDQAYLYGCNDTSPPTVGLCHSVTDSATYGLNANCKYDPENSRKYKRCESGWYKVDYTELIGEEIELPTHTEFKLKTDFINKQQMEDYVSELKDQSSVRYTVLYSEQRPYSNEIEVYWLGEIIKNGEVIHSETLSTKFPEGVTDTEIDDLIFLYAGEWKDSWIPDIRIRNAK